MSNDSLNTGNPIIVALHEVFGPIVIIYKDSHPLLAWGGATVVAILTIAVVDVVLPENMVWLIGIIIVACLAAFVFVDWDTRRQNRDQPQTSTNFNHFTIDSPKDHEEIPLGANQCIVLEGRFPIVTNNPELAETAEVAVNVIKLPDRQSVPQTGADRVSTDRGQWRFESAKFAGEGPYEIIATVQLGEKNDWRKLSVDCIRKAVAYERSIQQDRQNRGMPSVQVVVPKDVSPQRFYKELDQLQNKFWGFYPGDPYKALGVIEETFDVLDPILPAFPDDFYLQNIRAYFFKNYAMVMRDLGNPKEFSRGLQVAEEMFGAIRDQNPDDAGAWNGLGSVSLLRGECRNALQYIDRALELNPNYDEAKRDKATVLKMIKDDRCRDEDDSLRAYLAADVPH